MTHTLSGSRTRPAPARSPGDAAGRILRAVAILACLPYIGLKIAWMSGGHVGIPEGSELRDPGRQTVMVVVNGLSVLMDAAVVVLALLLTRPWGLRAPAWLTVLPVWVACGLLAPIMAGFPAQLAARALGFGGGDGGRSSGSSGTFLAEWVFGMVYGGFIVQGLALGGLFVLYARRRWGHLWRGRIADLPAHGAAPATRRPVAVVIALLTAVPAAVHLLWAAGSDAGLSHDRSQDRGSDFSVLEGAYVVFALITALGVLMVAFRAGRPVRLALPLSLACVGSAALACWGGWLLLTGLTAQNAAQEPTALMYLTYAVQMTVGLLVLTAGGRFFRERGSAGGAAAYRAS
ncbi:MULTISPECIES: hypothetical protein [Streptomyces]|uniref:Aromatic ring-opening dioxygenase LigA n=1 Tax=Streptomyces mordarskii TaxID=1226758 RepID=A0ABP3LN38_9ACTN|nr:hypothetical protein [Streptomyces sp. AgN23]WTA80918.1 hypothetical protein OG751_14015 [Streptomyces antimycoticus]